MLRSVLNTAKSSFRTNNCRLDLKSTLEKCNDCSIILRNLHITSVNRRKEDRKMMYAALPKEDEGTFGESIVTIDTTKKKEDIYPDENTPFRLFNGVPFKDLPICNIKVTPNNTIFTISDSKGVVKLLHSSGIEGFKNCKKGTNIAAQTAAITLGTKAIQEGYETVRLRIRGLGPGRMASVKGLQLAGLNIISITDNTTVSWFPPRPRKQRRL